MILKETYEDFKVFEIIDETLISNNSTSTHLYMLTKTNYTTERAVTHIAKALHIRRKDIGYAGTKDKNAITQQLISIRGPSREKVEKIELKDIKLEFKGYGKRQLKLGDLKGNRFEIIIKDIHKFPKEIPETFIVPNYFDEQRFSTNNVNVGLCLVKRKFKEAVDIIKENDDDFKEGIKEHLAKQENDYVGALKNIPKKILLFYIHALQSKIFNDLLAKEMRDAYEYPYSQGVFKFPKNTSEKPKKEEITLIGYLTRPTKEEAETLKELEITPKQFLIPQLPNLSMEGSSRKASFEVRNCKELERGDNWMKISFELGKGSYATIVIKSLFARV